VLSVRGWLDLTAAALRGNPDLSNFAGRVSDSGEGRWTVQAAVDEGIPSPVISAALSSRFASRGNEEYAAKLLSAMRYEFGGQQGEICRQAGGGLMGDFQSDAFVFFGATGDLAHKQNFSVAAGVDSR